MIKTMSDYIKQLERDNEKLRQQLVEAERIVDWHNYRQSNKLLFNYKFNCTTSNNQMFTAITWDVTKSVARRILETAQRHHPEDIFKFHPFSALIAGENHLVTYNLILDVYKKTLLLNSITFFQYVNDELA